VEVHPTAIVAPGAVIGAGTTVGPYAVIGPHVVLGRANRIGPHVVLDGHTTFGDENTVFQFASIGSAPQDLKFRGEPSTLVLGDRNIIREYVTIQPGTKGGGMQTVVGSSNLFMANSHIGHDCRVGDGNVVANSVAVAGHVTIGSHVILGGLVAVHQFVRIGDLALLSGGSMVTQDIPPFCLAQGDRARLVGINVVGLERRGVSPADVRGIRAVYRTVFLGKGVFRDRITAARAALDGAGPASRMLDFLEASERGVAAARRGASEDHSE